MSFAPDKPGFWETRISFGMIVTLTIIVLLPWFILSFAANLGGIRFAERLAYPWAIMVGMGIEAIAAIGNETLFRWIGTPPAQLFMDLVYGDGMWISRAMYGFALAPLAFLFGINFFPSDKRNGFGAHGSARFADDTETKAFRKHTKSALWVGSVNGTLDAKQQYYYHGNRHLLSLAPTRSGKGTCLIVPNLIAADRSILVVDPKGENARVTAWQRSHFGPVHVIDPFGVSGQESSAYNPLQDLDPANPDFADDAATLASALIVIDRNARDKHFEEGARSLMRGLVMFAAAEEPEERRTLTTIRDYLTWPKERFDTLLALMAETETAHGAIKRAANTFLSKNDKEMRSIISTAQEQTLFLESPHLAKSLARSDVSFADLKRQRMTIYLVLPESRFESHGRWLRLLVARACQDIERTPRPDPAPVTGRKAKKKAAENKEPPVLFLLDEFAAIGDMPAIRTAVGLMAGYDLQIWAFLQNWGQLEELYGAGAHTFAANAGVFHAFNVNDNLTARYVSDLSGDTTFSQTTYGGTFTPSPDGIARSPVGRKLMTPEEVMHKLSDKHMFLKYSGTSPIIAKKAPYFEDKWMKSRARA